MMSISPIWPTSLARRPEAYISSRMARSRNHSGGVPFVGFSGGVGASKRRRTCEGVSTPGRRFHLVG